MLEKAILLITVYGCLTLPQIYDMYYANYHRFVESPLEAVAAGLLAPLIMMSPLMIAAILFRTKFTTRLLAGLLVIYALDRSVASMMPSLFKSGLVELIFNLTGIILLLLCLRYLTSSAWKRVTRMILAAVIAWALVLPANAWLTAGPTPVLQPTLDVTRVLGALPHAVTIMIMDEASPESLDEFAAAFTHVAGQSVHSTLSESAGWSTVFAIPSMLTVHRHDGVVPCGATELCGSNSFNMRNLAASRPDTDVVGTYHPYCAMRGLRSCWTTDIAARDAPDVSRGILGAIGRRLPFFKDLSSFEANETVAIQYARKEVASHVFKAPFWKHGGVLYMHYLLPHPLVWSSHSAHIHDLSQEYTSNISSAAHFVHEINLQLRARFGLDYALIVTSDHSLRTPWWCAKTFFDTSSCLTESPPYVDHVPFLVLAPDSVKVTLPTTNVGIFTPLPKDG